MGQPWRKSFHWIQLHRRKNANPRQTALKSCRLQRQDSAWIQCRGHRRKNSALPERTRYLETPTTNNSRR